MRSHLTEQLIRTFTHLSDWVRRHDRWRNVGLGVLVTTAVVLVKIAAQDVTAAALSYVLVAGGIAAATWYGRWLGGGSATGAALLFVCWTSRTDTSPYGILTDWTALLFLAEAVFFICAVARLRDRHAVMSARLADADAEVARLRRRDQERLLMDQAFD